MQTINISQLFLVSLIRIKIPSTGETHPLWKRKRQSSSCRMGSEKIRLGWLRDGLLEVRWKYPGKKCFPVKNGCVKKSLKINFVLSLLDLISLYLEFTKKSTEITSYLYICYERKLVINFIHKGTIFKANLNGKFNNVGGM